MGLTELIAPANRSLVLITGAPRSGTTWVGDILSRCPRSALLMEPFNPDLAQRVTRFCNHRFGEWFTYITDDNAPEFERPITDMLSLRHPTLTYLARSRKPNDCLDVLRRGAKLRLSRFTSTTSLMKDPIALLSSEWLARRFGAKVIVLIRHPAAIVSSFKKLKLCVDIPGLLRQKLLVRDLLTPLEAELCDFVAAEHDLVDRAAMLWKALYSAVLAFQKRHPEWLFVRHEDLSRGAIEGFERLCTHAGLDFDQRARQAANAADDVSLPAELHDRFAFTTRRNAIANLSNWKTRLSEEEVTRIRHRVGDVASHFYADSEW